MLSLLNSLLPVIIYVSFGLVLLVITLVMWRQARTKGEHPAQATTQPHQAKHEQQRRTAQYRALFEQMRDGVFLVDLSLKIIAANPAGAAMLGYRPDEMIGRDLFTTIPDQAEQSDAEQRINALLRGEVLPPYERTITRKDGTDLIVEISAVLIRDENDQPLYMQTIFRDMSVRKIHQENHMALAIERERVRLLQQFISHISHDLRTPMTNIKTSTYLLRKVATTNPIKREHYIGVIDEAVDQLQRVVEDQLEALRESEQAEQDIQREPLDINEIVRGIIATHQPTAEAKHQRVSVSLADNLSPVLGNAERLKRGIGHIMQNAHQYTAEGGVITVKTYHSSLYTNIVIEDNGIGIPATDLPHIFDTFYRVDAARNQHGAGLGLVIAQQVINAHGGHINVNSTLGTGSKFTISLPMMA